MVLRLEDHDQGRCRPEFEAALLADLAWLGFMPPAGHPNRGAPWRQSERSEVYGRALAALRRSHHVYGCQCSRAQLRQRLAPSASNPDGQSDTGEWTYDGHCRHLGLDPLSPGMGIRVAVPLAMVEFHDLWLGPQGQAPASQCGDLLLRERSGSWTYQFAVVVDDLEQGIDLVIRGQDLLASTGRQIWLAHALGGRPPESWLHHPLLRTPAGVKLSKRDGSAAIATRRLSGEPSIGVISDALARLGYRQLMSPDAKPQSVMAAVDALAALLKLRLDQGGHPDGVRGH